MAPQSHVANGVLLGRVLPDGVASVETYEDCDDGDLYPQEASAVARAVPKRRREYATVRWCARRALAELGRPPAPILRGPRNEPLWPAGIVGSMTHCDGYRAAALAPAADFAAIGIDAEPHSELSPGVLEMIARPEEIPVLVRLRSRFPSVHWDKLTFSAKESVYKAWFPLAQRWLDFHDATVRFEPSDRTFAVELHQTGPEVGGVPLTRMRGRFAVGGGLVVTAVTVPSR